MDLFKTLSTFDVKGPIRKKDHLRVISAHNSLVYAIEKRDREIERLQDQIKALQTQLDNTFNIPSANPVVEKVVDALFGEYLKKKQIDIFENEILPRCYGRVRNSNLGIDIFFIGNTRAA